MMSRRTNRHKDATQVDGEANNTRSCTPERAVDPTESNENNNAPGSAAAAAGSVNVSRAGAAANVPVTPSKDLAAGGGSSPQNALTNPRQLMSRLKSVVNEMVQSVQNPVNLVFLDDYIAIADEGLKALRTAKVDARTSMRRMTGIPVMRRDADVEGPPASAATVSTAPQEPEAAPGTPREETNGAARSYIAALKLRALASPSKNRTTTGATNATSASAAAGGAPAKPIDFEKRPADESVQREGQALRNEERRRAADERRREMLEERQAKQEETAARTDKARQRRVEAAEKLRNDTKERTESASKRADENLQQVKERAQKSLAKVDDVLFVNDMQQKVKSMKAELKASEADQHQEQLQENRREELQRAASVRQEAHTAVIDRQRDLSQQRAERQLQREQQRQENLKRLEESKRAELEQKHQKAEERERRVQQNQQEATAEAEAKSRKTEERIQQSVQLREEQREKQKIKSDKYEQKQKEAKERRDQEVTPGKTTFAGVLPVLSAADEELAAQRLARSVTTSQRQGRAFVDTFQKECALGAKDVNKSRLRAIFSRISPTNLTTSRTALHEIAGAFLLSDVDHEYIRFSNSFDALLKVFGESRKSKDTATLKTCSDVLHRLFLDPTEGGAHIKYFVRAGHLMGLMVLFYDEVKSLRKHNQSTALTVTLSLVQLCVGCIVTESQTSAKLAPLRDQMITDLDAVGVDRFCFAVASTCVDEEDVPALQYSLLILSHQLQVSAKRKADSPTTVAWIRGAVSSLFTLLLNLLSPKGQPITQTDPPLSSSFTAVMFASLRVLNCIARWRLDCVQDLLRSSLGDSASSLSAALATATNAATDTDPLASSASAFAIGSASRVELYHIALGFFTYIGVHGNLERMATDATTLSEISAQHPSASFTEAVQFGVTRGSLPRAPLPSSCSNFSVEGAPSSARSSVTAASTTKGHDLERPHSTESVYLRAALHELLLLLGYVTLAEPSIQEIFSWGKNRPLLSTILNGLPMQYYAQCRHILFPTLLSIADQDARNQLIVSREMDKESLTKFLEEEYNGLGGKLKNQALAVRETLQTSKETPRTPPPTPVTGPAPAPVVSKNWADDDDDDEGCWFGQPAKPAAAPANPTTAAAAAPEVVSVPRQERERLVKLLRQHVTPVNLTAAVSHYRIERRFPPSLWLAALSELKGEVTPPATALEAA